MPRSFPQIQLPLQSRNSILKVENEKLLRKAQIDADLLKTIQEGFREKFASIIVPGEVEIDESGRLLILGDVLFQSGVASLKQKGKQILGKVAEIINRDPDYTVQQEIYTVNPFLKHSSKHIKCRVLCLQ